MLELKSTPESLFMHAFIADYSKQFNFARGHYKYFNLTFFLNTPFKNSRGYGWHYYVKHPFPSQHPSTIHNKLGLSVFIVSRYEFPQYVFFRGSLCSAVHVLYSYYDTLRNLYVNFMAFWVFYDRSTSYTLIVYWWCVLLLYTLQPHWGQWTKRKILIASVAD